MGSVGGEEPEAPAHPVGRPGPAVFEGDTPAGLGVVGLVWGQRHLVGSVWNFTLHSSV